MAKVIRQFLLTRDLKKAKKNYPIYREIMKKKILKKIRNNQKSKVIYLHNLAPKSLEIAKLKTKCLIKSYQKPKLDPKK